MKTITLWLVEGHTGEYSDRNQWPVAACVSEEAGRKLETACEDWAKAVGFWSADTRIEMDSEIRYAIVDAIRRGFLPDAPDQSLQCDYTGVDYVCFRLDLRLQDDQEFADFADALVAYRAEPPDARRVFLAAVGRGE